MKKAISLPFEVPAHYRHLWILYWENMPLAIIAIDGTPEVVTGETQEADDHSSQVLDWIEEVMMTIECDCKPGHL